VVTHRDLALLSASSLPFSSPDWLYELKFDGYRALALRDHDVRLVSRHGRDLTAAFPEVSFAVSTLSPGTALDGEIVVLDREGRPQFAHLGAWRSTPRAIRGALRNRPATLMAFDILADAGLDVRSEPIEERKARLATRVTPSPHLRPVLPVAGSGEWLYAQAEAMRLEGVVAKKKGSAYPRGRTADWLKIKTPQGRDADARRFGYRRA
jgi:bifunctional non-homologous end joining protein LigD